MNAAVQRRCVSARPFVRVDGAFVASRVFHYPSLDEKVPWNGGQTRTSLPVNSDRIELMYSQLQLVLTQAVNSKNVPSTRFTHGRLRRLLEAAAGHADQSIGRQTVCDELGDLSPAGFIMLRSRDTF